MNRLDLDFDRVEPGGPPPRIAPPRVSVIVTCFNYAQYVCQALDSVAGQTYPHFNFVAVDDCSTDHSFALIQDWIKSRGDPRFRLIRNATNKGQMGSFAAGLGASEGEFVAFLDADDVWFPEFLASHIKVHLNRVQQAGFSSSDLVQIDQHGTMLCGSTFPAELINAPRKGPSARLLDEDFSRFNSKTLLLNGPLDARYYFADFERWRWSVTSGMVFRRPLVELLMPKDVEAVGLSADAYLALLSHYFAGSFVINNALGAYRRHGKNGFSNAPVSGGPSAGLISANIATTSRVNQAMLRHLLDEYERLSELFGRRQVERCARKLFRISLQQQWSFEDARLAEVIGQGRVMRDRMRARVGFLRRKLA
jgi:glycosyltransferase involved in cell wall biosynthesis